MRFFLNAFILTLICGASFAQNGDLIIEGTSPKLYVQHTVVAKENWYSIGRLYNVSPKEIAPFNGATLEKSLNIGQQLKIPLTNANFSQDGQKASDEVFVPVYHIVQDKEWLFRISSNYNKVAPANIEKWNGINNDQLKAGMKLIVGYLKVKPGQSALASKGMSEIPETTVATTAPAPPVEQPVVKVEEKKPEPVVEKPAENKPVTTVVNNAPASVNGDFKGGYFRSQYESSNKSSQGAAAIFRSTSGWSDGKYYALMNNVPVGTIIKVSNTANNKVVYAKVLGNLADIKENVGLTIRISNAAAADLGAGENKFNASINY